MEIFPHEPSSDKGVPHLRNPPYLIYIYTHTWGFPQMKVPSNGWLISFTMENPIELDDLGVPPNHRKPPVTTWS